MMTLGDFFRSAPHANPVNPRPVTFTCVAKGETLPGGAKNQPGRVIRAKVTAAFVFLSADDTLEAREDARAALRERAEKKAGEGVMPQPIDGGDYDIESMYQMLQRSLREWDEAEKRVGGAFFPNVDVMRELVVLREANRLYGALTKYIEDEHPEDAPSTATFRKPKV